jgi:hypothetical protein
VSAKKPEPADFWRDAYALARDLHEIEVRMLQNRIDDLLSRGHQIPRPPDDEEGPGKGKDDDENPLRKSNPVQWIMDSLEEVVPLGNENARQGVRSWVQRQIRLRGQGSIDEILEEAIQGDVTDEHEEEVEP